MIPRLRFPRLPSFVAMSVAVSVVALAGCDGNLGSLADAGASETSSSSGELGDGDGDDADAEVIACIGGSLCPDGRSCANGVCLVECSDDPQCRSDEYCVDGLCQPKVVPTCNFDSDCAATQECSNRVCTAPGTGVCDPADTLQDGCPAHALCIEDLDSDEGVGACYSMPACAEDGSCPVGVVGSVCNLDYLPNKARICMIGICENGSHCPAQWSCIRYGAEVLGACSDGSFGSPCVLDGDCLSGNCFPLPGLDGGVCG
jgi:hypothetical protein